MEEYLLPIFLALFGWLALAALLLIPLYRFLRREEAASSAWTDEAVRERAARQPRPNGAPGEASPPDAR